MKYLILLLALSSCAKENSDNSVYGHLTITSTNFKEVKSPLFKDTVEASLVIKNNELTYLSNTGKDYFNLYLSTEKESFQLVDAARRFSYVFKYQNTYYNFYSKSLTTGDVFLSKSSDLIHWDVINNGLPVLTQESKTNYQYIWNVGVTVDDQGVWHLLAETSIKDNAHAGLTYSTATMTNDQINFDTNKNYSHLVGFAGNPWLKFIPGKGILVFYGKYNNEVWEVRAGTLINGVLTENQNFRIYENGIHICDPHLEETAEGSVMVLSYDQHAVYELKSTQTLSEIFEELK